MRIQYPESVVVPRGGGGVLRFGSDGGVPLKPPNPEKGTHY